MGVSTDGQISYGVVFEEGYEFPWDDEEFDDGLNDWWLQETGWKFDGDSPYTDSGEYAPGVKEGDPRIDAWYDSRYEWTKSHPFPFELVNYQSDECPAYLLAIASSVKTANRGYPLAFDPGALTVSQEDREALEAFCVQYNLTPEQEAGWYLTSYWG